MCPGMNDTQDTNVGHGLRARLAASPWARLAGKLSLYALGFGALALVGSGRWLAWVPPARGEGLPAAIAASAIAPSSASAAASAAPSASASSSAAPDADADAGVPEPAVTPDGKVAINRANEADLRRLPGVGATRAKAILALRDKLGGKFKRPDDLLKVKGIGRKSMARLRPLVIID
jgi:competence protein ComEA